MRIRTDSISIVGLGKLGLPLAAVFADSGYKTFGIDINKSVVNSINEGVSPIIENGLDVLIKKFGGKSLIASADFNDAIKDSDVTYILTATPSMDDGSFSNEQIESALKNLAQSLAKIDKKNHLFVISSTVMPGSITKSFIPLIEKYSNKKLNNDFFVAYCPDTVALGEVINGFQNPDFVIIGQSDDKSGLIVKEIHERITKNNPPIKCISIASAEIAKVALNAYITMKISFANNLANISEKVSGSDVDEITGTIGLDKRISPYYFKGGMSFGGTCFPRDTFAFNRLSQDLGISTELFDAVENINQHQDNYLAELVLGKVKNKSSNRITILGMSFKMGTPVIEESAGLKLVNNLLKKSPNTRINAIDPKAKINCESYFMDKIEIFSHISDQLNNSDIIVLINNEKDFIEKIYNLEPNKNIVIIDCWRVLDLNKIHKNIELIQWAKNKGEKK